MFNDDSAIRQLNREVILLLGGGRALLMQLAHPQVAAGVAEHSAFQVDPLGRFLRTVRPVYAMIFGTTEECREAAAQIAHRHRAVVGAGYRADDPELQLWVHATLVDSALVTYRRFVGPVPQDLEAAFFEDSARLGRMLGIPSGVLPTSAAAFNEYVETMSHHLEVSAVARALSAEVFTPRPQAAAPAFVVLRELTSGLLPPALREQYGLGWGPGRESVLRVAAAASRIAWPRLPSALRYPPALLMPASASHSVHA
jgi:uncharacterized protein (DUF2236 family)